MFGQRQQDRQPIYHCTYIITQYLVWSAYKPHHTGQPDTQTTKSANVQRMYNTSDTFTFCSIAIPLTVATTVARGNIPSTAHYISTTLDGVIQGNALVYKALLYKILKALKHHMQYRCDYTLSILSKPIEACLRVIQYTYRMLVRLTLA